MSEKFATFDGRRALEQLSSAPSDCGLQNGHDQFTTTDTISRAKETNNYHLVQEDTDIEIEGKGCGWLCFRPKCLQVKQTSKWILFWLCWAGAVQGMVVNGFVNVCITTIEKRYHLKSADAGIIAGAYDIASVMCSIPVSYLGSLPGASKPRWLGWGIMLMGLGSFVFASPHFISPLYKDSSYKFEGSEDLFLCNSQVNSTMACSNNAEMWLSKFRHVFALGQFFHGLGASPLYTLGITFLYDSVPMRTSSLYLGVFYAMAIVGPACGYVLGGQLLNIYIDTPSIEASQLGIYPSSDQWLGAWWVGFLLSGTLSFMIAWVVMAFPKEFPDTKLRPLQHPAEANASAGVVTTHSFQNLKDLPKASKVLASNFTFLCLSLAGATEGVLLTGFATFMPKFIESQFSIPASSAALLVGMVAVPAGGGGTVIGGWIIKHYYMKCAGILKLCACLSALCFVSCLSFVISCPDTNLAGVTVGYLKSPLLSQPNLMSTCNLNCGCQNVPFNPVCGTDQILYFSPCHAGCTSVNLNNGSKVFEDCKCISEVTSSFAENENNYKHFALRRNSSSSSAFLEKCPSSCSLMTVFLLIFFVIMTFTFVLSLPAVTGTLRCVPDSHRSLALGLQWIIIRILGTIPGPILFGLIIDSTCRYWQKTCDVDGACRNYNNLQMSRSMLMVSLVCKCLSTLFFIVAWRFYTPSQNDVEEQQSADGIALDDTATSTTSTSASTPTGVEENRAFEAAS